MSVGQHLNDLGAFHSAVADLYEAPLRARLASVAEEAQGPAADEARVDAVVAASRALTESTAALLQHDDPLVRESGEARLAALAARDIAVAFDVAQLEVEERPSIARAELVGPALPSIEREIAFVLEADPARGVPPSPSEWKGRAQLAGAEQDPDKARMALRAGLPKAIEQVRDDATEVVLEGLKGLLGDTLGKALGALSGGLLDHLPDQAKPWYQRALDLLKEGIRKLRKLFGPAFDKAVQRVTDWLEQHGSRMVADRVYDVATLSGDVTSLVDGAPAATDWAKVGEEVQTIVDKHATQKKIVLAVFKALEFAHRWILRAISGPAGEAVVGGAFVLGAAYALFAGGDYVDWHRTEDDGAFDFVRGIRLTATNRLT